MSEAKSFNELLEGRRAKFEQDHTTFEWRAFTQEAKRAANYACQLCRQGGPHMTLMVHHPFYVAGKRKWEYEISDVQVLCGPCHEAMHKRLQQFRQYVFPRLTPEAFRVLNGALSVGVVGYNAMVLARAVANMVASPGAVKRFSDDWREG